MSPYPKCKIIDYPQLGEQSFLTPITTFLLPTITNITTYPNYYHYCSDPK